MTRDSCRKRTRRIPPPGAAGFTLLEFVLVMGLLATVMALAAPSLSRYFQERTLEQEAARLLAVTEYARSESISLGIPMVVWMAFDGKRYGLEPGAGYPVSPQATREYELHRDVTLTLDEQAAGTGSPHELLTFTPDGTLTPESLQTLNLVDRRGAELALTQTTNQWAYEIVSDTSELR